MRPYLVMLALLALFAIPTRPFVLAWAWLRSCRPFQAFEGRMVALAAAAEHKPEEPKPPAP